MLHLVLPHVVYREAGVEHDHDDEREKGDHLAFRRGARAPVGVGQALVVESDHAVDVVRRQAREQHLERRVDSISRLVDLGFVSRCSARVGRHSLRLLVEPALHLLHLPVRVLHVHVETGVHGGGCSCRVLLSRALCARAVRRKTARHSAVRSWNELKPPGGIEELMKVNSVMRAVVVKVEAHTLIFLVDPAFELEGEACRHLLEVGDVGVEVP
eukprot:2286698-Pleurochrysis_carterae.AAC.2